MTKKIVAILLVAVLVQLSCTRKSDDVGPVICPSSSLSVTTPLVVKNNSGGSTLDLLNSYAVVTMTFSESINYTIVFTGTTSGATYTYNGTGSSINYSWHGNSDNGIYFQQNEIITYKVTNVCVSEPLGSGQIQLTTIVSFKTGFGLNISGFDFGFNANRHMGNYPSTTTNSPGYYDTLLIDPSNPIYSPSPQGGSYINIKAKLASDTVPQWYFGSNDFPSMTMADFTVLGHDPTRVYLNFYAKGQENSQAQFTLSETVHGITVKRTTLGTVATAWQKFSVRLSDFGIEDPSQLTNVSIGLAAAIHKDYTSNVDLDMIIFTLDKPL